MKYIVNPNFTYIIIENFLDNFWKIAPFQTELKFKRKVYDRQKKTYTIEEYSLLQEITEKKNPNLYFQLKREFPKAKKFYRIPTGFLEYFNSKYKINISLPVSPNDFFISQEEFEKLPIYQMLRYYQKEAVQILTNRIRGIVEAPTGAGKTLIILSILQKLKPDKKALIIVPKSSSLLIQHLREAHKFFPPEEIGYYYSKGKKHGKITYSTINSLQAIPYLNEIDILIIDECQATPANSIQKIISMLQNCWIRYGLSATPFGRSDELDFLTQSILGTIVYKVNYDKLKNEGFLSDMIYRFIYFETPEIFIQPNFPIPIDERYRRISDYNTIIKLFIEENPYRIKLILDLALKILVKEERNLLIITDRKDLGHILNELFRKEIFLNYNISHFYINGETPYYIREKVFEKFRKGEIKCIISTQLIEYGIDLPNLNTIILASIGKSPIQLIQRIGRGLRKSDKDLIVYDLVDKANYVLIKQGKTREKLINQKGFKIEKFKIDIPNRYDYLEPLLSDFSDLIFK